MTLSPADALALHATYAAACRAGDVAAVRALTEPDAVVWHNFDDTAISAARAEQSLAWLHRTVPDVDWKDVAVLPTPHGFVWQSILTGHAPGGELHAHSCLVVTLSEAGKIQRSEEYVDAAAIQPLYGRSNDAASGATEERSELASERTAAARIAPGRQ
jgi:ketosteroid isomerase-like protein